MKILAITLAIVALLLGTARADYELTREEASTMKSYRLEELNKLIGTLDGRIVRIKFMNREPDVVRAQNGPATGGVIEYLRDPDGMLSTMRVTVDAGGADWFQRLPAGQPRRDSRMIQAIGRVGLEKGRPHIHILGREVKTDLKGPRVVW